MLLTRINYQQIVINTSPHGNRSLALEMTAALRDPTFVIAVSADDLVPNSVWPSAQNFMWFSMKIHKLLVIPNQQLTSLYGPLLLTWFIFNLNMDK